MTRQCPSFSRIVFKSPELLGCKTMYFEYWLRKQVCNATQKYCVSKASSQVDTTHFLNLMTIVIDGMWLVAFKSTISKGYKYTVHTKLLPSFLLRWKTWFCCQHKIRPAQKKGLSSPSSGGQTPTRFTWGNQQQYCFTGELLPLRTSTSNSSLDNCIAIIFDLSNGIIKLRVIEITHSHSTIDL